MQKDCFLFQVCLLVDIIRTGIHVRTQPIESLMNRIMSQYNKHPEGWKVLSDQKGNVLIFGPRNAYRLKLIPLSPEAYTGVGAKLNNVKEMQKLTKGGPQFGLRPLSHAETRELLTSSQQGQAEAISKLLEAKPLPVENIFKKKPTAILSGPIISHPNLSAISKSQKELESKLAIDANRLFRKRHPGRAAIYR